MNSNTFPTFLIQLNNWLKNSTGVKLFVLGFMLLILLIPLSQIEWLMHERQERSEAAMLEVSDKWSRSQTLAGPILALPYTVLQETTTADNRRITIKELRHAYFLPENLSVEGTVEPDILHRGIFDVVVYTSAFQISGSFTPLELKKLKIKPESIDWAGAHVIVGIEDLRGIQENPSFSFAGQNITAEPGETNLLQSKSAIIVPLALQGNLEKTTPFQFDLRLKGSRALHFLPTGKTSQVQLVGTWPSPSFTGDYLPEERNITESGFQAIWKILHFNRPFPQQWTSMESVELQETSFGVNLLMGVDQYQQSIRTTKYGILVVFLTFLALFLIELIYRNSIHFFQYILIAAALTVYYTLIVSISEHLGFEWAYLIASLSTMLLISLYATTFLPKRLAIVLAALLSIFYGFIYTLTQQEDYALLIGSIGLFVVVAVLMLITKNIRLNSPSEGEVATA